MKLPQEVISRDTIGDLQRWQLPDMTVVAVRAPPMEAAGESISAQSVVLPTADELQAIYGQAEREGREQGNQQGYAAGYAEGMAAAAQDQQALQQILHGFSMPLRALDVSVEQSLLALAMEIARQVIRHELILRPESLLPLLREALRAVPVRSAQPSIRLHPDDLALVERLMPELTEQGVVLQADAELERGGVLVAASLDAEVARPDRRWQGREFDHAATQLDLRLETRWRETLDQLFGEIST
ncbi:flagellar assembly protein FliH [Acidithiobacillus sp.]